MALLDGQYNILSEQDLGPGRSLFEATKRSGERVRILWYELMTSEDELAFEDYRQLLRQLKQQDLAAIHDIVSRPGANYVVWEHPVNERAKRNRYTKEVGELLVASGYRLEDAHIHIDEFNQAKLYMLELSSRTSSPAIEQLATSDAKSKTKVKSVNRRTIHKAKNGGKAGPSLFGFPIPPFISWLPGVIMVALAAGLLNYSLGRYVNTQEVLIPDLVGLNIDIAGQEVQSLGLNSQVQAVVSDEEEGTVVNMQPKARAELRQGRTVQLMYAVSSLERTQVVVPQLVARGIIGEEAAKVALEEAGLKLGKAIGVHSSLIEGQVIAQSIAARKTVGEGSSLDVIFSKGPRKLQTFMPDFRGMMLEEAQPYIDLLGLTQPTQVDEHVNSDVPSGTILKQYIKPNTIVDPTKTTLRLLVATEGELEALRETSIPNFIGILNLDEAYDLAAEYGFEIAKVMPFNSPNLNHGVIAQTPRAYEAMDEITDQITLMFNTNGQHLAELRNQRIATTSTTGNSITGNVAAGNLINGNLTPLPNTTNIGVVDSGTGVNQFGTNPNATLGAGGVTLAPNIPQTNFVLGGGGTPTPNIPTGVVVENTDVSGMTPITIFPVDTPSVDTPSTDINVQPLETQPLETQPLETQPTQPVDVQLAPQLPTQTNTDGVFSYFWTIPPVTETQLVAIHVILADGSSINVDNRWLEVGATEVTGIYAYPGYTGELTFELSDYNTNAALAEALIVQP